VSSSGTAVQENESTSTLDRERIKGICEAVIFAADKPVTIAQLRAIFDGEEGITPASIQEALDELKVDLGAEARGLALVEISGGFAFRTKPDHRFWVSRLTTPKAVRLSRASLETLAIVAYRQPVTRAGVDDIRGVDSGAVLKGLLEKRVVKILGRQEGVGNPIIYGTTKEFLEAFGLKDLAELPTLKEFQELDDASRRTLDAHGITLDEPPTDEAIAASEAPPYDDPGIERTGQTVPQTDDSEDPARQQLTSDDEASDE